MPAATHFSGETHTTAYDVAEHLRTPQEMADDLNAWLEDAPTDGAGIAKALRDIARAQGLLTQVAQGSALSRESLDRALSAGGNLGLATFLKVS